LFGGGGDFFCKKIDIDSHESLKLEGRKSMQRDNSGVG